MKKTFIIFIVAILLFLLAKFIIPSCPCASNEAKYSIVCHNMKGYAHVLEQYKNDNGNYPTTKEDVDALINHPKKYLIRKPRDSWGADMVYYRTDKGFEIVSYGADKKKGGEDEYKDIYYSECEDR
jgi:general secretion pathway protein G